MSLSRRAVLLQRKLMHVRTGVDCGKDVSRSRATCEDGITMERDLWAVVVELAIRTAHARSYFA